MKSLKHNETAMVPLLGGEKLQKDHLGGLYSDVRLSREVQRMAGGNHMTQTAIGISRS